MARARLRLRPRPRHSGLLAGACHSFRAWARARKAECACAVLECAPLPAADEASGRIRRRVDRGRRKVAAGNGCGARALRRRTAAKKKEKTSELACVRNVVYYARYRCGPGPGQKRPLVRPIRFPGAFEVRSKVFKILSEDSFIM